MTKSEFYQAVKNYSLRDALYFARILGVSMAQSQLWVRGL